jgi:hypothetical protein
MGYATQTDEMSVSDAAAILSRTRTTIIRMCAEGRLKSRRRGGYYHPVVAAVKAIRNRDRQIAELKAQAASESA